MISKLKESLAFSKGLALAAYRYAGARREVLRLRPIDSQLSAEQLGNLKPVPDRLALLDRLPKGGVAAEIGVAGGAFSREIFDRTAPAKLYLIDYWKAGKRAHGAAAVPGKAGPASALSDWERVNRGMQAEIASGRVELRRGFSRDEIALLPDAGIDWAYLDAGHDYLSVKKDLAALLPKLKPGGIIAGHDYVKWWRYGFRCGVVEAVNEFCLLHDFELILISLDARIPSSFAIRKR